MRRTRMKIQLKPSEAMSNVAKKNKEEHGFIRLPKAARLYYQAIGNKIEISAGPDSTAVLEIHSALKKDVSSLKTDKNKFGFVTKETFAKINSKSPVSNIWASENIDNLVVGSDPEFGLVEPVSLNLLYAQHHYAQGLQAKLGHDGPVMELRPDPTPSVEKHCENIKNLLARGAKKDIGKYLWFTGASYQNPKKKSARRYTMGGHIHIGEPSIFQTFLEKKVNEQSRTSVRYAANRRLIRVLDEMVGLPLTKIDGPSPSFRRNAAAGGGPYGAFGDFRAQPNRVEWRTPSSIWLNNPDLAMATLTTAKAVAEEFYRLSVDKNFNQRWISAAWNTENSLLKAMNCIEDSIVQKKINSSSLTIVTKAELETLYQRLRGLSQYKKYKTEIELFIALTSISKKEAENFPYSATQENWLR